MDWVDFYARAKRVVPPQELKPKRRWIGVLSHEKDPHSDLEETDFVWMIGHNVCWHPTALVLRPKLLIGPENSYLEDP
jgi:hypothetical protein